MNRALKEIYAERRNRKLKMVFKMVLWIMAGAIGIYAIWNFVQIDFCQIYYQIACQ